MYSLAHYHSKRKELNPARFQTNSRVHSHLPDGQGGVHAWFGAGDLHVAQEGSTTGFANDCAASINVCVDLTETAVEDDVDVTRTVALSGRKKLRGNKRLGTAISIDSV